MSTCAALPPALHAKLLALAHRIRLWRALRGASLVLLVLLLTGSAALWTDAWLGLPAGVRALLLAGWLGLGAWMTLSGLLRPNRQRLSPEVLAALIEEKYPELGERLTSAVELAGAADAYHGSPALIGLLMSETEVRSRRLDYLQAFPVRASAGLATAAGLGLLAVVLPALLGPGRYAELGRRFLLPWRAPQASLPYTLEVTPGHAVVAKGRPLKLSVQVRAHDETVVLPRSSTLVITDAEGKTSRLPMRPDRPDAFSQTLEHVSGDFRYQMEVGDANSENYQVTAVVPVEIAADSPTITVTPPAYAQATVETQTILGVTALTALQHSRIRFDFRFTVPAVTVQWKWLPRPGGQDPRTPEIAQALPLTPDRLGASLELPALVDGQFQLVLEGEQGIRTELAPQLLIVRVDQPPQFVKAPFSDPLHEELKAVLPYDTIPLEILLADDVGVERAEIEYRRNEDPPQVEPIPLQGGGTRQASAKYLLRLPDKGFHEGDVIRYRLKVLDNRRVPAAGLEPNITYYPGDRWLTLKLTPQAVPLRQQELAAEHNTLGQRLEALKAELLKEQRGVYKLRQEARGQATLKAEQVRALKQLRQENRAITRGLRELAHDSADTPALQPLVQLAQEVADGELHRSEEALQAAEKEGQAEPRDQRLHQADQELTAALERLEGLRRVNDLLAQKRLDQLHLHMLAERQQALAGRAAREAPPEGTDQAATEPLQREQNELARKLQQLGEQSNLLRDALKAARTEQARQLADRARELAQTQRELTQTAHADQQRQQGERLAELTRQQRELAEQADRLARETHPATQAARVSALQPQNTHQAAVALQRGDAGEALQRQDQSARELERLAADLARATERARDPREAAGQLARLQESLRQRLKEEVKKSDPKVPLAQQLQDMQREQDLLRRAVKQLSVPEQKQDLQKEWRDAAERANQAVRALHKPDPAEADTRMKETREALERLVERLPSLDQRQRQAQEELARLRSQQQEVNQQAERAAQQAGKDQANAAKTRTPLEDVARRQAELAERLNRLDTPRQETQREQARQALEQAQQALKNARPEEIGTSQQEARRALERLAQQLAERAPPPGPAQDQASSPRGLPARQQAEQARQLAQQQRDVRAAVQRLAQESAAAKKDAQQDLQQQAENLMQELNRLASQLERPSQSQQALQQAANSARQGQTAMRQAQEQERRSNHGQAQQAQQRATQALEQAGRQADLAAPRAAQQGQPSGQQTGQALGQAQAEMRQAQSQLTQGQNQGAQTAMQRAAEALQHALRQLTSQPGQADQASAPPQAAPGGIPEGGTPDQRLWSDERKRSAGKPWGELPGELRTKVLQEIRAQYGEDYARIIKLYFEQIADTKK